MKTKLTIDFIIQLLVFIAGAIFIATAGFEAYISFYFILGGYQLISHYTKYYMGIWGSVRRFYNYCLWPVYLGFIVSAIIITMDFNSDFPIYYAFTLLFGSPILAIINIVSTYIELTKAGVPVQAEIANN